LGLAELTDPEAVRAAIREFDEIGRDAFLDKYGFGPARDYFLVENDKRYDSKAIVGAAHGYQHPGLGPLPNTEFSGGAPTTSKLEQLGFNVEPDSPQDSQLFIFTAAGPRARANLARSLEQGIPVTLFQGTEVEEQLAAATSNGYVLAWGARPGGDSERRWSRLRPGDWGLLYTDRRFPFAVRVVTTARLPEAAERVWGRDENGDVWECMYFLDTKTVISAEKATVLEELGYAPTFVPQGFAFVGPAARARIQERHGGTNELIRALAAGNIDARAPSKYWWVNQGRTFDAEAAGGFLWAPLESSKDGRPRDHWLRLREARRGDEVFHYAKGEIRAVGEVLGPAIEESKPADLGSNDWSELGLRLPVRYQPVESPLPLSGIPVRLRLAEQGPFTTTGSVQQGYFFSVSTPFGDEVKRLLESPSVSSQAQGLAAIAPAFASGLDEAGLSFDPADGLVNGFLAAVATKPFAILSGLSGSGKTQLALKLGEWLGPEHLHVAAVRPDWTSPDPLFGYEDALSARDEHGRRAWHVPDPLAFALRAASQPSALFLLLLDEMNLAHVERYFSDFLSGMESLQPVLPNLEQDHGGQWRQKASAPTKIPIPPNLIVVGTVNVDETTYMFSPKVLDRANTFEFRVPTDTLKPGAPRPAEMEPGPTELITQLHALVIDRDWHVLHPHPAEDDLVAELRRLHALLIPSGHEFGHRTFSESLRFAALFASTGVTSSDAALDRIVLQKILPKLHGSRRRLSPVLETLATFARTGDTDAPDDQTGDDAPARLPLTLNKVERMARRLTEDQFASFAE
jgi:5-methylcytosine-specific restriction enzyme B